MGIGYVAKNPNEIQLGKPIDAFIPHIYLKGIIRPEVVYDITIKK